MTDSVSPRPTYAGYLPIVFVFGFGALFGFLMPLGGAGWLIGAVLGYFISRFAVRAYFDRKL